MAATGPGAGPGGHLRQAVERPDVAFHQPGEQRRPAAPAVVGPEGGVESPPPDPEPAAGVPEEVPPAVDAGHGAVEGPDPAARPGPADTARHRGRGRPDRPLRDRDRRRRRPTRRRDRPPAADPRPLPCRAP